MHPIDLKNAPKGTLGGIGLPRSMEVGEAQSYVSDFCLVANELQCTILWIGDYGGSF